MKQFLLCSALLLVLCVTAGTAKVTPAEAPPTAEVTLQATVVPFYPELGVGELSAEDSLLRELNGLSIKEIAGEDGVRCGVKPSAVLGIVPLAKTRSLWLGAKNRGETVEVSGMLDLNTRQISVTKFSIEEEIDWLNGLKDVGNISGVPGL